MGFFTEKLQGESSVTEEVPNIANVHIFSTEGTEILDTIKHQQNFFRLREIWSLNESEGSFMIKVAYKHQKCIFVG